MFCTSQSEHVMFRKNKRCTPSFYFRNVVQNCHTIGECLKASHTLVRYGKKLVWQDKTHNAHCVCREQPCRAFQFYDKGHAPELRGYQLIVLLHMATSRVMNLFWIFVIDLEKFNNLDLAQKTISNQV